jgi:hypothetical protein
MKTFFLLLFLPLTTLANFSVGDVDSVKLLDGQTLVCNSDRKLGGRGYYPSEAKAEADKETVRFSFLVNSVICTKINGVFTFASIAINEPILAKDIYGNPIRKLIVSNEAILVSSMIRALNKVAMENLPTQKIEATLVLDSLLNPDQLEKLNSGKEVAVRMEYFQSMGIVVETKDKLIPVGVRGGGNFAFYFKIKRDENGNLLVSNIAVQ